MAITMAVTYCNFAGSLIGEIRGGVQTSYLSDPLGSCIGTTNSTGAVTSTTDCWPYGEVASSTGVNPSPWCFVGLLGYFADSFSRTYIRARYFSAPIARWTICDKFWPEIEAYQYCNGSPIHFSDPSGNSPQIVAGLGGCVVGGLVGACTAWGRKNPSCQAACRGVGGCVLGATIGVLGTTMPTIAACLLGIAAGALSSLINDVCNYVCTGTSIFSGSPYCYALTIIFGSILGCAQGILKTPIEIKPVLGIINASLGQICNDWHHFAAG